MRYRGAATAAILACGAVLTAADAPTERYVSVEGGFVAYFPVGAEVKEKTEALGAGLKSLVVTATQKGVARAFIVTSTPHQKGTLKANLTAVLDLGEKVTVGVPKTTRLSAKDFTVGKAKYPAREVLTLRDGNETRTRFIVADPVLYSLVVGGPKEFASGKEATNFLDTFEPTPSKVKAKK